jgi:2-polyprenyl-6-methoxyphenol hydroxylase-like FAD-dependent oxidoreductase
MTVDVAVVGGGPTGLMLACELRLAGVRPVILERLPEPSTVPRSNGLVGQIVQMLDYRGLLERVSADAAFVGPTPFIPFGALPLDLRELDPSPVHRLTTPQHRIERMLAERANELGVEIRRGHELTALSQDEHRVVLDVRGPEGDYRLDSHYLVGCDGGHSVVRKQAGIDFPGSTNDYMLVHLGDVTLPESMIVPQTDGALEVPGLGRLPAGLTRTATGVIAVVSFTPGVHRVATIEWGNKPWPERDDATTIGDLRDAVQRVIAVDLPMSRPEWVVRIVENTRQAVRYREGRVLLVGDAAHVHSSTGGPGLNLGLQDAINLAWKLAGQVRGWAPSGLLDTYHAERHPVGERVLMHSQAQTALLAPGEDVTQLRELFGELFQKTDVVRHMAEMLAGTDVRYDMGSAGSRSHPLLGQWVLPLVAEYDDTPLTRLMERARPVIIDLAGRADLAATADGWKDRVDLVRVRPATGSSIADALLIRPDGYVAWAAGPETSDEDARDGLLQALNTWFGVAG